MAGCMEEYKETGKTSGKTSGRHEVKINQSIIETNMKHTHTHLCPSATAGRSI